MVRTAAAWLLVLAGLAAMIGGVYTLFGTGWALVAAGAALSVLGLVAVNVDTVEDVEDVSRGQPAE